MSETAYIEIYWKLFVVYTYNTRHYALQRLKNIHKPVNALIFNVHFRTFDDNLAQGRIKYRNQMGETFCNLQLLATILNFVLEFTIQRRIWIH